MLVVLSFVEQRIPMRFSRPFQLLLCIYRPSRAQYGYLADRRRCNFDTLVKPNRLPPSSPPSSLSFVERMAVIGIGPVSVVVEIRGFAAW